MRNPALREKFSVGQIVDIPKRVAMQHTAKLTLPSRPILGRVLSMGNEMNGKRCHFTVTLNWIRGSMKVWEEWQLEQIHAATPNQYNRFETLPDYLQPQPAMA